MDKIEIRDFADEAPGGHRILREKTFREKIDAHDWSQHAGKAVLIQGCSDIIIPTWAYLVVAAKLVQVADRVYFGEQKTRVPIFDRASHTPSTPQTAASSEPS